MNSALAQKLFDAVYDLTKYDVSIIDENGKIVASKNQYHLGAFHETAFEIAKGSAEVISIDRDDPESGVMEGVYIGLSVNKTIAGVIGVYGHPREVLPVARCMKLSLETMLEFERYKSSQMRGYTAKERFLRLLFYSGESDRSVLEQTFLELGLDRDAARVPVLIELENASRHLSAVKKKLEASGLASRQDLLGTVNEHSLFLLMAVSRNIRNTMQDYKYLLGEYLSSALKYIRSNHLACGLYIGPIQNDIFQYRQAFLYCTWMQKTIRRPGSYYFYDYIAKYLYSMISQNEYNAMFSYLRQSLDPKFLDNYVEIVSTLTAENWSFSKASGLLHIHKNTLIYRLDKIRETLHMNPLTSNAEREFMECFCFYLKRSASVQGGNTET